MGKSGKAKGSKTAATAADLPLNVGGVEMPRDLGAVVNFEEVELKPASVGWYHREAEVLAMLAPAVETGISRL